MHTVATTSTTAVIVTTATAAINSTTTAAVTTGITAVVIAVTTVMATSTIPLQQNISWYVYDGVYTVCRARASIFKVICRLMLMEYVYFTMQMFFTYNRLHVSLSIASSMGALSSHNNVISSYAMLNAI